MIVARISAGLFMGAIGHMAFGGVWADDVADRLAACRAVSDADQELACYRRLTDDLTGTAATAPQSDRGGEPQADAPAAKAPPQPQAKPRKSAEDPPRSAPSRKPARQEPARQRQARPDTGTQQSPSMIQSRITDYRKDASGRFVFLLENGQIWRETSASNLRKAGRPGPVRIEPGALGSQSLYVEGWSGVGKVERIR